MFRLLNVSGRAAIQTDDRWHDLAALSGDADLASPMEAVARFDELHALQQLAAGRSGDGSMSGVSVVSWTAVAAGSPTLTATFTQPDGSTLASGSNDPFTFDIAAPVDLAVAVNGV